MSDDNIVVSNLTEGYVIHNITIHHNCMGRKLLVETDKNKYRIPASVKLTVPSTARVMWEDEGPLGDVYVEECQ